MFLYSTLRNNTWLNKVLKQQAKQTNKQKKLKIHNSEVFHIEGITFLNLSQYQF